MAFQLGECLLLTKLKENNMSQAEFARRMNCTRQYVNKLVLNRDKMSLIFAINASFVLNCNPLELYKLERQDEE